MNIDDLELIPVTGLDTAGGGDWPAWMAPGALFAALVLANVAALILDIPAAILGANLNAHHLPGGLELADTFVQDFVFVGTVLLFAQMRGQRPRSWQFGLRATSWWGALGWLVFVAVAYLVFSAVWGVLLGNPHEELLKNLGANQGSALLILSALLTCVMAPICEEFLFRGFVFSVLRKWRGPWLAALLTGMLFGAFHFGSAPAVDLVPLAVLGAGLCLLYWRTNSLYPCIVAHSINNCVAFGSLEDWHWWQSAALLAGALGVIRLLVVIFRRVGLIATPPGLPAVVRGA